MVSWHEDGVGNTAELVGVKRPFSAQISETHIRDERSGMESYPYPVKEG